MSTQPLLRILRVEPPTQLSGGDSIRLANAALGGQAEWHFAIPSLFRALASPGTGEKIISPPTRPYNSEEPSTHYHRLGYWAGLLYLLNFRLGWVLPAQGLALWTDAGLPEDDPTLRLVNAVWGRDGRLADVLGWESAWQPSGPVDTLEWRPVVRLGAPADHHAYRWTEPPTLGPTGCHLQPFGGHFPHAIADDERRSTARMLRSTVSERRAVLLTGSMVGWYGALRRLGADLPAIGSNSWRVDVVVTPIGHLGTFRRSRETNMWFTGKHSTHVLGN